MNQTEERTSAIGYLNYGKSYLDCATFLVNGLEKGQLETAFDAPVYQLLGQTYELFFKAIIRTGGNTTKKFRKLGHNLMSCADEAQKISGFEGVINDLDEAFKSYWRNVARASRTAKLESLPEEFRAITKVDTDQEIEQILPDFIPILEDLNNLYDRPYYTRYFERGSKRFPQYEPLYLAALLLYERARIPCYEYSKQNEKL